MKPIAERLEHIGETIAATDWTISDIENAIRYLRAARNILRHAGAKKAADYVARALKSAEGALRHAQGRMYRG